MIDRNLDLYVVAGEPVRVRYRRQLADGATRELVGEVYAFTIYAADGTTVSSVASAIGQDADGDYADMTHPATLSVECAGRIGLRWELAEVLPVGRQRRFAGRFSVARGPGSVAGSASPYAVPDIDWIIERDSGR